MVDLIVSALSFLLVIMIIVVVHEGGHFSAAKICRVKVLAFSIGFGQKLFSFKKGGTDFSLSAIPLGGYVQMLEVKGKSKNDSLDDCFESKSLLARSFIIIAGPAANFILASLIYWIIFMKGIVGPIPYVGDILKNSVAATAGFKPGDQILKVNGKDVQTWEAVHQQLIIEILKDKALDFIVSREDGSVHDYLIPAESFNLDEFERNGPFDQIGLAPEIADIPAKISQVMRASPAGQAGLLAGDRVLHIQNSPIKAWIDLVRIIRENPSKPLLFGIKRNGVVFETTITPVLAMDGGKKIGRIGIQGDYSSVYSTQRYGFLDAAKMATEKTLDMTLLTIRSLMKIFTLELSLKNISGPITIADYAAKSLESGVNSFLGFLALISISIGIINLLPIPMLDGGHLLYNFLEWISGKKLSTAFYETSQKIGIAVLLSLFFVAIYNDIFRLVN